MYRVFFVKISFLYGMGGIGVFFFLLSFLFLLWAQILPMSNRLDVQETGLGIRIIAMHISLLCFPPENVHYVPCLPKKKPVACPYLSGTICGVDSGLLFSGLCL